MKKIGLLFQKLIPTKRKLMQLYFALLFNANLKGFVQGDIYKKDFLGNSSKVACMPGLNCYSCPGAVSACPLGSLQGALSANKSAFFYVGGILLLYGILFGRLICGWLCPFGLIQELLYKIKTPKLAKGPVTRILTFLKYVILVVFVFIIPIAYALKDTAVPGFCKYICPAGIIEGALFLLANIMNARFFTMLGPIFTWKFLLMISIVVGCVFAFRLFCRFICPLGAIYGLFNRISVFGVKVEENKCINCDKCIRHCKMDIKKVGDSECISCGECIDVCPTNAIRFKGILPKHEGDGTSGGINSKARKITRSIVAILMSLVLIGSFIYYWVATPDRASVGSDIGDACPSYNLSTMDETGYLDAIVNPTAFSGKITIVNFWGTWCGPCKAELPYFDQIAEKYNKDVVVVTVHTSYLTESAPAYIAENYKDSNMIFAIDQADKNGEVFFTSVGGTSNYPYTVVLDENGVIVEIFARSVHYEDLESVVQKQLQK